MPLPPTPTHPHRLCLEHMRASEVTTQDGSRKRFCQKCVRRAPQPCTHRSRLTPASHRRCIRLQYLHEFDGSKRTCVVALTAHNARRRMQGELARANGAAGAPPAELRSNSSSGAGPDTSSDGDAPKASPQHAAPVVASQLPTEEVLDTAAAEYLSTWLSETVGGHHRMEAPGHVWDMYDAMAPHGGQAHRPAAMHTDLGVLTIRPTDLSSRSDSPEAQRQLHRAALMSIARAASDAAAAHGCTLHIKLPEIHTPTSLPGSTLRGVADALLPGPLPATVAVRPGCVLLTLDALVPLEAVQIRRNRNDTAEASGASSRFVPQNARRAATIIAGASLGVYITAHGSVVLMRSGGPSGPAHVSTAALDSTRDASYPPLAAGPHAMAVAPQLVGAAPGALVLGNDGLVTLRLPALVNPNAGTTVSLHARVDGHTLRLQVVPDADAGSGMSTVTTSLPAGCAPDGAVILMEVQESTPVASGHPDRPAVRLSRCMPVLLCVDAAAVAQVNAWCASAAAVAPDELTVVDALDTTLRLLGAAMRADAPLAVRVSAAKACTAMNWDAMLRHLLTACVTGDGSTRVRGALILACSQQLRVTPGAAACAAVLRELAPWANRAGAVSTAARLLRHASDVECHTDALCATHAALDAAAALKEDGGAGEVLLCMSLLLSDGSLAECLEPPAVADVAHRSDGDAAERYATFCLVRNYSYFLVVAVLRVASGTSNWWKVWKHVVASPDVHLFDRRTDLGVATAKLMASVRFHPFRHLAAAGAQPFTLEQVNWLRVLPAARAFVASEVLVRLPMDITLAFLAARYLATASTRARLVAEPQLGGRVAWLVHVLLIGDALMHVVNDLLASWAAGWALPEWPIPLNLLHALGLVVAFAACVYPARWMHNVVAARFAATFAVMLVFVPDALRMMFFNIGYLAQLVALITGLVLIPSRDAASWAQWLASEASAAHAAEGSK